MSIQSAIVQVNTSSAQKMSVVQMLFHALLHAYTYVCMHAVAAIRKSNQFNDLHLKTSLLY